MFSNTRLRKNIIYFRNFSIKQRLYSLFITFVLIIMVSCIYFIVIAFEKELYSISNQNLNIINKISPLFQNNISTLASITKYPILQTPNRTFMYNYLIDLQHNSDKYNHTFYQYNVFSSIQAECNQFFYLYPTVTEITLFDTTGNGTVYFSSLIKNFNASTPYRLVHIDPSDSWFQNTLSFKGSVSFLTQSITQNNTFFSKANTSLYASRAIVNPNTLLPIGAILVRCDLTPIILPYTEGKLFENQRLSIYNKNNQLILETSPPSSTYNIYDYSLAIDDYLILIETPLSTVLINFLQKYILFFILLITLCLLLIYTLKLFISSITEPINTLIKGCNIIESGDFSMIIKDDCKDEIADLVKNFNAMSKQINKLVYEGYEKDLLHNQLELQMLRAQINPHFLYNTLESIRSSAYLKGAEDVSNMALLLGNTLRYGVSNPTELVTVRTEINSLKDYIDLQKIRYKEKLNFILNIEEHLLDCSIIKVILQPLVENAIFHGISSTPKNGIIHIMGYQENELLIFKVLDNGIGIDEITLQSLNSYINNQNDLFKSIGLKNVHRRLQLYYGDMYGLYIESILGQGTAVTLKLPYISS